MTVTTPLAAKSRTAPPAGQRPGRGEAWRIEPEQRPVKPAAGLFQRMFTRREPTTFHRCLAVHMHFARCPSALE